MHLKPEKVAAKKKEQAARQEASPEALTQRQIILKGVRVNNLKNVDVSFPAGKLTVVTGLSVAREREVGTFDQLLVSPATPTEIALAKLLPGCIVGLIHGTIFLLITVFAFGVPFTGSLVLLYAAVFIFALASGGVGLMVSSLAATQQQAFLGAFTIGVPCILISGAVTPVINMPPFLQYASELNPVRHFTTLAQGVFLKDISLTAALLSLGKIALIALVCIFVAVSMFRRRV